MTHYNYNYKICIYSTSDLLVHVALIKYLREVGLAERPLVRITAQEKPCRRSISYIFLETIQAASAFVRLSKFAAREYECSHSDAYTLIHRTDGGGLEVLDRGLLV